MYNHGHLFSCEASRASPVSISPWYLVRSMSFFFKLHTERFLQEGRGLDRHVSCHQKGKWCFSRSLPMVS